MEQEQALYGHLGVVLVPHSLRGRVCAYVARAQQRQARVRLALLSVFAFCSGLTLVPVCQYAVREFYASGFYDYASLFYSDSSFALSAKKELLYSLLESLPSLAILLVITCVGALVWSLWRALATSRVVFVTYNRIA